MSRPELDDVVELTAAYGVHLSADVEAVIAWVLSGQSGQSPAWSWWQRWADSEAKRQRWARGEARRPINQYAAEQRRRQRRAAQG